MSFYNKYMDMLNKEKSKSMLPNIKFRWKNTNGVKQKPGQKASEYYEYLSEKVKF